ncbi:MAG: nucleoside triphosphate pyrophosphohydrolase [Hyphomicrobium sp.]|jgi:ATP diphosphatase|nr:nucleoside triphosphate pyrophosphohydrolase [Hyphomicrobium sp.]PPD08282.1 MAG: nucleoside triphosphate pyrophosphohydrolase [Hyphomicrobium sp.]
MTQSEPSPSAAGALQRLIEIMAALRTPETGCPWDLEQTFQTIAPYTIEEAYEVADAISRGDLADLKDELGDLLLQVVYHSRMAEEQGAFAFADVADAVNTKMIRRHPHVFGSAEERAAGAQPDFWARIKAEERAAKAAERARFGSAGQQAPSAHRAAVLADVPVGLPALTRAIKLQDKAARVGFDWPDLAPVFAKMKEEIGELEEVAFLSAASDSPAGSRPEAAVLIEEEMGDMLFVMANIARHLKLDPETALRKANDKFMRRFAYIERRLAEMGKTPEQSTLEEMDALWDEVRAQDKARLGHEAVPGTVSGTKSAT